jgi:rhamnosyltransferase
MTSATSQLEGPLAPVTSLGGVGVVIPTYNAARYWVPLRRALDQQGLDPEQILIVDSSSNDQTRTLARDAGYCVVRIDQRDFSHGGTRQLAVDRLPWADILLYLTQDALPAGEYAFRNLCSAFADPRVGATYGRQLPRPNAGAIERHARLFNYPAESGTRTYASRYQIGIKAAFLSNSFAAYRRSALTQVGGFPNDVIMAEDSLVAARMLLAGLHVAYVAEAAVIHSHPLTLKDEFCRYFDTGVHHTREHWILDSFGDAGGEGKRFLRSEFAYLLANEAHLLPLAALRTFSKFLAYQLGRHEDRLALSVKLCLSSQPGFWHRSKKVQAEKEQPSGPAEAMPAPDHNDVHRSPALTLKP